MAASCSEAGRKGEVRVRNHGEITRRLSPELHISQIPYAVSVLKVFAGLAPAVFVTAGMSCESLRKRSGGGWVLAGREK